jgi:type II secretion system protein G
MQPILRLAIRLVALAGAVIAGNWIAFNLTTICFIPHNERQFVLAQFSLEHFGKALERYRADCGGYPDLKMGMRALVTNPGISGWNGPYTKEPLIDPWGRPYLYEISTGVPNVRSLGADGKPGGDLFDADLSSQNPMAPLHESRFHAAQRFFVERILPWPLFGASLYAWFRAGPRRDIVVSE